ncbi:hypothetical protein [Nocardia huaxiensis]|uniref:Uncharacterized protein n=1 Tax=Nocardia huaxiensis TaxID=2755382 RepID=A0A7D6Z627_9NOCA|nr:hypothetical protein [Nocardia huaxiensis]QLY33986.1 hypothetical protein H0264_18680 [Nocardia huaxiensis]UFS99111.1 hypothetical protein LPY97_15030 [Nocardia huaxiensis]
MNSQEYARRQIGLSPYGRPEYDPNGLLEAGFQAAPLRWRLPIFVGLVLFAAGIVVGIQLEQQTPTMPASVNVCRADEASRIDCVHVDRQAPLTSGVTR